MQGGRGKKKRAVITNDFSPIGGQMCNARRSHFSYFNFWGSVDYDLLIVESWICR